MTQPKSNPKNDRVKRDYLVWLTEAKQRSAKTAEAARHAIDRLEAYTGYKDFRTFNKDQAVAFKRSLEADTGQRSGQPISISTIHHTLRAIREFLVWLHGLPEYRARVKLADIAYLNLTTGEVRQAQTARPKRYASLEEYRRALFAMPIDSDMALRDRAVVALLLLTGMRDAAAVSVKLRHVDIERGHVFQDPRDMDTKFSKAINSFFFPVGDDVAAILQDWVARLTDELGFGPADPLFPKTLNGHDENMNFTPIGLGREHWANAKPVCDIFKAAFERVGLPYVTPHTVRNTLTQLAYQLKLDPEAFKAWSQNMGHDKPLTTFNSYGSVTIERQAEIIDRLGRPQEPALAVPDHSIEAKLDEIRAMLKRQMS
jgi:integrase